MAPVNAVEPGSGLHIWWQGLWMERAEGISLNQLSYITRKTFVESTIMDLLQAREAASGGRARGAHGSTGGAFCGWGVVGAVGCRWNQQA